MKARLRAAIAWQGVAEIAIKSRVQLSDLQLDQEAQKDLTPDMSYDYVLKEILFITSARMLRGAPAKPTSTVPPSRAATAPSTSR